MTRSEDNSTTRSNYNQECTLALTTESSPDLTFKTNVQSLLVVGFLKILQILKARKISVPSLYQSDKMSLPLGSLQLSSPRKKGPCLMTIS